MLQVAGLALPFFGLIFLGFFAGKIWRRDESELGWLNIFVIYFALPALFFQLISRTPIGELANGQFIAATALSTFLALALSFAFATLRNRGNPAESAIQALIGGYGNVGYMGPPLALVAFGSTATVPAALIFCFDIALVFTLVPVLMAVAGRGGESKSQLLASIPRKVLLHPFVLAALLGVAGAAVGVQPPDPIDRLLDSLAAASAPCALFALGVTVASRPLERVASELPVLIAVKLLVHPLLAFLILSAFGGFQPTWIATAVLMASLPPAATIYVIATQYRTYVLRASSAILVGTGASVVTVTGVLFILTHHLVPGAP
jgi:hypothetical protein